MKNTETFIPHLATVQTKADAQTRTYAVAFAGCAAFIGSVVCIVCWPSFDLQ